MHFEQSLIPYNVHNKFRVSKKSELEITDINIIVVISRTNFRYFQNMYQDKLGFQ